MSCGVGCKRVLAPALLWLWCRLAAVALIGPLAWEPPYAADMALKSKKKSHPFFLQIRRCVILGSLVALTDPLGYLLTFQMARKGQGISGLRDASVSTDPLQKNREVSTVPQALI